MSDPYERVKGGRLSFKGGEVAVSSKAIAKSKKKKKKKKNKVKLIDGDVTEQLEGEVAPGDGSASGEGDTGGPEVYTIDAAKKKKYADLFPVEAKKFGYDPNAKEKKVEDALDDRVKKKADRYCK